MNNDRMQNMAAPGQDGQPVQVMSGAAPRQSVMPPVMGSSSQPLMGVNGMPMMQASPVVQIDRGGGAKGLLKTILIIALLLATVAFAGLFIWKQLEYIFVQSDLDGQIAEAVEQAKYEQKEEDLAQFAEEEKYPLRSFVGPADYGQLSFEYPKTWSLYIAKDAANGGDYEAYFNPIAVEAVSNKTVNALRLLIRNKSFDDVTAEYRTALNNKKSNLSMSTVEINGITMDRYVGTIPGTEFNGVFVVFKIRDKTAVIRTDAEQFVGDFDAVLKTIQFNI